MGNGDDDFDLYDGLPMPIQDNEFEDFDDQHNAMFTQDVGNENSNAMTNGGDFNHLKLAKMNNKKSGKGIDIRKGINIEKNVKMVTDENGSMRPTQEFDLIQHSQSNFDGVKGALIKHQQNNKKSDFRSKAAL